MNTPKLALGRAALARLSLIVLVEVAAVGASAAAVGAQEMAATGVINVATGNSTLLLHPVSLQRVSIADPAIADAVVVSAREIVINGKANGTTSLLLWDNAGGRELYSVRVTPDAATLERDLEALFPDENFEVKTSGNTVILSGDMRTAANAKRAAEIATGSVGEGVIVLNQISVPQPDQILLQVRFAEVSRNALEQLGINILRMDPFNPRGDTEGAITAGRPPPFTGGFLSAEAPDQTFSDAINLYVFNPDANLGLFIQALKSRGLFKSLAEPNLLAIDGAEATFLAGGEFPFPVLQGGAAANAVTIQFKEFGIRLNFTPTIVSSGLIRLKVEPEVSSLDFANGLQISGFSIPALLTRRAKTEIELADGQTFAIAGLIDNTLTENVSKVPILGDIPILGALFRSKELRQNRSELLVLVTPHLVRPADEPLSVPTGEPETWKWKKYLEEPPRGAPEGGDGTMPPSGEGP
ncbi:MAG: type II and III secretion system protein family protein [Gemmatimonadota bacterium]